MARKTILQLTEENAMLASANEHLKEGIRQRDQDFITLEKSYEKVLADAAKLETKLVDSGETNKELADAMAKLQKDHDSHKSMREHYSREHDKAVAEIESVHAVLDSVEGGPARTYELNEYNRDVKRSTVTRLAGAFLAIVRK